MNDERLRELERAVEEAPGDLVALRRWADARKRAGLELLPMVVPPAPRRRLQRTVRINGAWASFADYAREGAALHASQLAAFSGDTSWEKVEESVTSERLPDGRVRVSSSARFEEVMFAQDGAALPRLPARE